MIKPKLIVLAVVIAILVSVGYDLYARSVKSPSPDFTVQTMDGKSWTLSDYRGKKPVLLSFYATWCGPCNMEVPHLARLAREYKDRGLEVVVLGQDARELLTRRKDLMDAEFNLVADAQEIFDKYKVSPIPHTIFFTPEGTQLELIGYNEEGLKEIEALLQKAERVAVAS